MGVDLLQQSDPQFSRECLFLIPRRHSPYKVLFFTTGEREWGKKQVSGEKKWSWKEFSFSLSRALPSGSTSEIRSKPEGRFSIPISIDISFALPSFSTFFSCCSRAAPQKVDSWGLGPFLAFMTNAAWAMSVPVVQRTAYFEPCSPVHSASIPWESCTQTQSSLWRVSINIVKNVRLRHWWTRFIVFLGSTQQTHQLWEEDSGVVLDKVEHFSKSL